MPTGAGKLIHGSLVLSIFPLQDSDTEYQFTYGIRGRGYFFGARVTPSDNNFLDITLEAETTGWVAVGFSQTPTMVSSDLNDICTVTFDAELLF